jgi:hypothetical protein
MSNAAQTIRPQTPPGGWPIAPSQAATAAPQLGLQCNSTGLWHVVLRFDATDPNLHFARTAVARMVLVDPSTTWRMVSLAYPHTVTETFHRVQGWQPA